MRNGKRIHEVKVVRDVDTDPDTSYLGKYSNSATREYSIDRAHSLDCPINTGVTALDAKTRNQSDIPKSRCECADKSCPTACNGKCQMAASYLLFRTDMGDASGTMFCVGCGDDAFEAGIYIMANDLTELECDCDDHGDMERGQYQYFNPSSDYKDETPENTRKYIRQDYERMERLNRGDWCYLCIHAEAEVIIDDVVQTIRSGGLCGTESDSDETYLKSIEQEELDSLKSQLHAIGFSKRAISAAFREVSNDATR